MTILRITRPAVKPDREDLAPDSPDRREPFTQSDLDWADDHLNANCIDYDVAEGPELEWLSDRESYERWLDSLAPSLEELEHRARCDAFLARIIQTIPNR